MSVYYKWFRKVFGCSQIKITCTSEDFSIILDLLNKEKVYFWGVLGNEELGGIETNDHTLTADHFLWGSVFSAPEIIAVVTPTILPVPTVPEMAVENASKGVMVFGSKDFFSFFFDCFFCAPGACFFARSINRVTNQIFPLNVFKISEILSFNEK